MMADFTDMVGNFPVIEESCSEEGCCSFLGFSSENGCHHSRGGCWHNTEFQRNVKAPELEVYGQLWFSSIVDTLHREKTGTMCVVDKTHLYLRDYTKTDTLFFTVPLQFLVVKVDDDNHCSFSLHLNIKSSLQTEPHFFLHALTNQLRNQWLCIFSKRSVLIYRNNIYKSTPICPFEIPNYNRPTWRQVIWI